MTDKAEKPFWAYDWNEIMTPQLAEEIGHDIYRAWTGEEPPSLSEGRGRAKTAGQLKLPPSQ